jgi:transposase InsO family protein
MTVDAYCATVGMSTKTLCEWKRRYAAEGPKGLEPRKRGPKRGPRQSQLPGPVQAAITETKARFPDFGLRKVRDFMARFLQLRVSTGGVRRVLRDAGVGPVVRGKRRYRRIEEPRRFERSRPGQLWQSDITSFRLARHDRRVYLTVFLDDFSRYVVAWNLQLHQRQELVTECLLEGIQSFGKPKEVLTDRGRQYYAWRGKSDFQKLLIHEGIEHVLARVQHPETVGKCERLWDTVSSELWERTHPQELDEARERMGNFFKHYNHFRTHQGIDGMTPADRFFGVADQVRREVLRGQAENALAVALGRAPQEQSYLVGNLDGHRVTVRRTEKGLEIETADGTRTVIGTKTPAEAGEKAKGHDHGDGGEEDEDGEAPAAQGAIPPAPEGGGGGAGALGAGERGGEEEGAPDGEHDPVVVAGADDEVADGGEARGDAAAAVATRADGALGDDGGAPEAAAAPGPAGGGGDGAAAAGGGAREGARAGAGPGDDPGADAGAP